MTEEYSWPRPVAYEKGLISCYAFCQAGAEASFVVSEYFGQGPLRSELEALADELRERRVRFPGFTSQPLILCDSLLFVLHRLEGFQTSCLRL